MRTPMLLGLVLLCLSARAQVDEDAFGGLFDEMTLREALDESIERSRVLVVYVDSLAIAGADEERSAACLRSAERDRLLRFWLRQHAVVVRLGPEDRELGEQIVTAAMTRCERARQLFDMSGVPSQESRIPWYTPALGVFVGGELFEAVTACRIPEGLDFGVGVAGKAEGGSRSLGTSMNWAVFELEFQLDRIAAKEPVWMGLHELRNPPLEAEARAEFTEIEDAGADRFDDGLMEDPSDVLSAVVLARTQAELGDRFGSAATYTWLWERGALRDPDFGPAIRTLIAAEVKGLVDRWENFADRFSGMKIAATERLGLETLGEFGEWVRLAAVTGDAASMLAELDYRLNSDVYGASLARDERRVLMAIAEAESEVVERVSRTAYELERFGGLVERYRRETSEVARPELRRLALDRAVLLHARLLEIGEEGSARGVAKRAIEDLGVGAGRAIVAGALVAGQARAWHAGYLPADGSAFRLREHLARALAGAEGAESGEVEGE